MIDELETRFTILHLDLMLALMEKDTKKREAVRDEIIELIKPNLAALIREVSYGEALLSPSRYIRGYTKYRMDHDARR